MNQTSNLTSTFDPAKLVEVTPNQRRSEPYHMRYSDATKRFRFSMDVFTALDLNSNGVSIFRYPTGEMILSVQGEEDSQVLKTRSNAKVKGKEFTSRTLANGLSIGEGRTDLVLTELPAPEGATASYFLVSELEEGATLPIFGGDATDDSKDDEAESQDGKAESNGSVVGRVPSDSESETADSSDVDAAEDQGDSEDELADDDFADDDDTENDDDDDDDLADFG